MGQGVGWRVTGLIEKGIKGTITAFPFVLLQELKSIIATGIVFYLFSMSLGV